MDIRITKTLTPKPKPADADLGFGRYFSDHLFAMDYAAARGWHEPRIVPYAPFQLDPAAGVFHYGQAMFEGSKAFRGRDGRIRLFRPAEHSKRLAAGAPRLCMPAPPPADMLAAVRALTKIDADWVPESAGTSLYLRPTLIATEGFLGVRPATEYLYYVIASPAGSYFGGTGLRCVRIWVETNDVRAPRGGLGATKAGANYVASLSASTRAKQNGFDQVLWLDGKDHEFVEEVGTMNVCFLLRDALVTPPLSDSILAGVTRDSVLTLARARGIRVEERPISRSELRTAHQRGELTEVFGTGTAAVISPVGELAFGDETLVIHDGRPGPVAQQLYDDISAIQYGTGPDPRGWIEIVD